MQYDPRYWHWQQQQTPSDGEREEVKGSLAQSLRHEYCDIDVSPLSSQSEGCPKTSDTDNGMTDHQRRSKVPCTSSLGDLATEQRLPTVK
eukprot:2895681-Amphidinium_carterae.1